MYTAQDYTNPKFERVASEIQPCKHDKAYGSNTTPYCPECKEEIEFTARDAVAL